MVSSVPATCHQPPSFRSRRWRPGPVGGSSRRQAMPRMNSTVFQSAWAQKLKPVIMKDSVPVTREMMPHPPR